MRYAEGVTPFGAQGVLARWSSDAVSMCMLVMQCGSMQLLHRTHLALRKLMISGWR